MTSDTYGAGTDPAVPNAPDPDATVTNVTDPDATVTNVTDPDATVLYATDRDATVPDIKAPDVTAPPAMAPGATAPQAMAPGITAPPAVMPGITAPPAMVPDAMATDVTVPGATVPGATVPGATVPDATVPDATVPDATVPDATVPDVTAAGRAPVPVVASPPAVGRAIVRRPPPPARPAAVETSPPIETGQPIDTGQPAGEPAEPPIDQAVRRRRRRRRVALAIAAVFLLLTGTAVTLGTYYYDKVPLPNELVLPEATTLYYSDGEQVMARLGDQNRTLLTIGEMNDAVKNAIVAAEDKTFWTNEGIDFKSVLRAAWNNLTGGQTQGGSTITQQYARIAAELKGITYSRKLREAVIAWKLADQYDKPQILEFYLNTVEFGRGAHGIEAAAQEFFGKTANRKAPIEQQVTVAEAMVLAAMVKQPYPDPSAPEEYPGYDPTRSPLARENSIGRWNYIRDAMVEIGVLTPAEAAALAYPDTVKPYDPAAHQSGMTGPTGLIVAQALAELRSAGGELAGQPSEAILNGGYKIVTTIDHGAQQAAVAAADIRLNTAPSAVRDQPDNWQAALVAVQPGTGRVLAYYGGSVGTGADHAGWYIDEDGSPRGYGAHPPGSTFKVYDLAEALRQGIPTDSVWDSPRVKEFPLSGRTYDSPAGPVRNASSPACEPSCTLLEATIASLNVPFFELTEQVGAARIIEMAARAGIDSMWATVDGESQRIDLRDRPGGEVAPMYFSTEVGIGQYPITVADHANGMATFAAGGKRAPLHFVVRVEKRGKVVYQENITTSEIGLTEEQVRILSDTLRQVPGGNFSSDWDAAVKTGTWQAGEDASKNAHVWQVGYTRALAAAVWLGTTDGTALINRNGSASVYGSTHAAPIWRQFMAEATAAMNFDAGLQRFERPTPSPTPTPEPTETAEPTFEPTTEPTAEPTAEPTPTGTPPAA